MTGHIRKLDSLRGLAALIVVVSHYANESHWCEAIGHGAGQIGVMLFFLLSGFLMAYLYFGPAPDARALRGFALARIARVVPLFYAVAIGSFVLTRWAPPPARDLLFPIGDGRDLAADLLFLHGQIVLWTIPPEIEFYALFALAWAGGPRVHRLLVPLVATLVALIYAFGAPVTRFSLWGITVSTEIVEALPYFAVGSLIGYAYRRTHVAEARQKSLYVAALLLIPVTYPAIFTALTGYVHGLWASPLVLAVLAGVFAVVIFLVPDRSSVLANPCGDFLGKISYSMYLLHVPVLMHLERAGWTVGGAGCLLFLAITIGVATASYLLIEAPARRGLRRLGGDAAPLPARAVGEPAS